MQTHRDQRSWPEAREGLRVFPTAPRCVEFSRSPTHRASLHRVSCSPSAASLTASPADLQPFRHCYKYGNIVHGYVAVSFLLNIR
jgi:hypothetical protein